MSSQDSVIILSDEEEYYLKIHYEGNQEFIEVPLEKNGNVLFEDITALDSKIYALKIEKKGSKRMVKLKDGYVKEPKEKWKNVKIYAVLKQQLEEILTRNTLGENLCRTVAKTQKKKIKAEVPKISTVTIPNNLECEHPIPSSSLLSSTVCTTGRKIKTEVLSISTDVSLNNSKSCHSSSSNPSSLIDNNESNSGSSTMSTSLQNNNHDIQNSRSSDISRRNDSVSSPILPALVDDEETSSSNSMVVDVEEPTDDQLFKAYNVSSFKELKYVLCRGDAHHVDTCNDVLLYLKRTLVAYPNNEIVRLIYYAARTPDILLSNLDPKMKKRCKLCREAFTFQHLFSHYHVEKYHRKFNADPPEISIILDPKIYRQYLDPFVLANLKIPEFKKMEESAEFSTRNSSMEREAVQFKYLLINRILQADLKISYCNTFAVEKLVFLDQNDTHQILQNIFTNKNFGCPGCKRFPNSFDRYIRHILSHYHIKHSLNQEELDNICKSMFWIAETSEGFYFLPMPETNRKRHHPWENVQVSSKRHKNF